MSGLKREMDQLVREFRHEGWTVVKTRGSHWKFIPPDGEGALYQSSTPSDHRSIKNFLAMTKRFMRSKKSRHGNAISSVNSHQ